MSDLFDEKAKNWDMDEMISELSAGIGASILERVPLHQQMNVMDFGAGTGLITSQVAPLVNKVVAVDISEAMLKKLISKPELKQKVETVCQDITAQPLTSRFDLIMSAMAMHHVKDTNKLLARFSEHLSDGAMIALADLDSEDGSFHPADIEGVFHSGFDRDEFKNLLEAHGFEDIHFSTAHVVEKEIKSYPVFLVTAIKSNRLQ